jgi:uncharacterized protein
MPHLARINLYPIKSLDGLHVETAALQSGGSLEFDRQWAIFDAQGAYVNGKRHAAIHLLRSQFNLQQHTLSLHEQNSQEIATFHLESDRSALETWLSHYFRFPVTVVEDRVIGFPDDRHSPGPTIVSTATLEAIAAWFPELSIDEVRQRFRTNLEIGGVPAFWEDRLFGEADRTVPFRIGDILLEGVNPCQRCIVPTRHPQTGVALPEFQKQFVAQRRSHLPEWATSSRFNHFYRLAVNTRVPASERGKCLQVGDAIAIES